MPGLCVGTAKKECLYRKVTETKAGSGGGARGLPFHRKRQKGFLTDCCCRSGILRCKKNRKEQQNEPLCKNNRRSTCRIVRGDGIRFALRVVNSQLSICPSGLLPWFLL